MFALEAAIGKPKSNWEPALISIASCTPGDKYLLSFSDSGWERAIDMGRALAFLKTFPHANVRVEAVAAADRRLHAQGYRLSVGENSYNFEDGEIERATERIRTIFAGFGSISCLANLLGALKRTYPYDFEMYLTGRISGMGLGVRDAAIPFGFAINLAVAAPIPRSMPAEPQRKWKETPELARDVVSALNVESFSGFAHMGTSTLYAEARPAQWSGGLDVNDDAELHEILLICQRRDCSRLPRLGSAILAARIRSRNALLPGERSPVWVTLTYHADAQILMR